MVAIYLKVNLPFTWHAARVITYNDAQKLVNTTVAALSDWDVQKRNRFFSSDPLDVYGTRVSKPSVSSSCHGITERCRSIARQRMLLGCRRIQTCAECEQQSGGEPIVQCDRCERWYHPHCQDTVTFELWTLWECKTCSASRASPAPVPSNYAPPIDIGQDAAWSADVVAALHRSYQLEQRFWQEKLDHAVTLKSLSCPFSASATEGPIGILKSLSSAASGRRVECMLRALLTARRYDVGEEVAQNMLPFNEVFEFTRPAARILLQRDAASKRKTQRGDAKLAALEQEQAHKTEQSAKKQRLADGLSQRVDNAEDLSALSQDFGTGRALNHQAQLWRVKPGKTKAATTARILAAMQASQNAEGEDESNPEEERGEEDYDEEFNGIV